MLFRSLVLAADDAHAGRPAGADPFDVRDAVDWADPMLVLDEATLVAGQAARLPRLVPAWEGWTVATDPGTTVRVQSLVDPVIGGALAGWMFATVALGVLFLGLQAYEYGHAYSELNLKLTSGAYGASFFMLTGFHGFHVTIGTIMLIVITFRCLAGHFKPDHHFAFEGVSWYWHFVDVVWLFLFIFV